MEKVGRPMIEQELDSLEQETRKMSSSAAMQSMPSYRAILQTGKKAVPDLLQALRDGRVMVPAMMLLSQITGADPVKSQDRGKVSKMADAWLEWASEKS